MAEDLSCGPEIDIPENNDNSKLQLEADAFLNAIAGGADEDQADEAAFFAANPDGIVVDDNGEVLESGANSKIKKGEKVEFINDDETTSEQEKPAEAEDATAATDSANLNEDPADEEDVGDESLVTFDDLGLSPEVLEAVKLAGYETPSPIQAKAIPALLQGANLLGTAQTGTGKTAAFSLPLLSRINFNGRETSMLVLTPTRELAIQVSDAIQQYAVKMQNVTVVPVYGGQDIAIQLRALKRKASIVVATPGRLIDHIKRGSISLGAVKAIVLDEADEMLDMGFMEDVETILKEIPADAQRALFSATMPDSVKKIIDQHLGEYEEARIEGKTTTVENICQRYLLVKNEHKIEALARVLEGEEFDGVLIFVRTKQNTTEVAEKLESRGFNVAPLNGDLAQSMRERTINRLKMGKLDIVVATDVAARGIDVDRISLVVNYDIPYDTESYVHRIGRTGRAGRSGNAILFITPREKRMLKTIEKATRQPIDVMEMPTSEQISKKRVDAFKAKVKSVVSYGELDQFKELVRALAAEGCNMKDGVALEDGSVNEMTAEDIAAAVIKMYQKKQPLFPNLPPLEAPKERREKVRTGRDFLGESRNEDFGLNSEEQKRMRKERKEGLNGVEEGFLRYYLGVGRIDHVTPRDIVGAIAGEANINSSNIGRIKLFDKFSTVELPNTLPQDVLDILSEMTIRGNDARFRVMTDEPPEGPAPGTRPHASREERRSFHRDRKGGFHDDERRGGFRKNREGGDRFGDKPFENRKARRERQFADRKPSKFEDKPFRKDRDERSFGDKPFRKTRRFGRV
ncbi:DEAD/DEAH box helicase domain protein [Fibrobacter succinogenes subsp. succinogenes S85]|uniref:RNA helicase n=1 Tax=Fibrobacter succinogenes (strain ATCC 19169 / S85) TaxID=59374 RepID=A0ABN3YV77_FIBSS|nr:DEAD/DEAH box helicase [Fibrobacter succinogenes]ACX75526.1 DEAD/DEAH box helicase domain protein [Fibrobacter succinogenes subsp. succinogenes S85]